MTWRLHSDRKMKQQQEIFDMVASVCVCVCVTHNSFPLLKQADLSAQSAVDSFISER